MAGKRFTVDAVFRGINKISKPARSMGRSISKFVSRASRQIDKLGRKFKGLGKIIKRSAAVAIIGLGVAMASTVAKGVEFEQTMVSAAAKFPGLIRQGTKEFEALEAAAKKTGKKTEFSATQSANAINFLAMAGFTAKQSIAALPGVVDLATASNLDLARATDIATDTLGAFGLAVKDPVKLAENLARVNDVLAKTTTSANTNMEQLFESIAAGGADFKTAGQSIETFAALTGVMANAGKKGETAGTVLRNVMVRLAKPVGEAANLIEDLGVKTTDQNGNFRDVVDILADFEKGLKGLGSQQRTVAISTIFGLRAQGGINILLKAGSKEIRKFRDGLLNAKGATSEMAKEMRNTLQGRINSLKSSFEGLQLTIFDFQKGPLSGIVTTFTNIIRKVDDFIIKNTALDGSFIPLTNIMNELNPLFETMATVGKKAFEFIEFSSPFLKPFGAALLIIVGGIKAWTIAQGFLNAALAINPIGLIIIAVASLVAGIVLLVQNWDKVVEVFEKVFNAFLKFIEPFTSKIKPITDAIAGLAKAVINLLIRSLEQLWEKVKTIFDSIIEKIKPFVQMFKDVSTVISDKLVGAFNSLWETARPILEKIQNFLKPITEGIGGIFKSVGDFFGGKGDFIKDIAGKIESVTKVVNETNQENGGTGAVTPQERLSRSIETSENNSTLTIQDRTGTAELSPQRRGGAQIALATSGGF